MLRNDIAFPFDDIPFNQNFDLSNLINYYINPTTIILTFTCVSCLLFLVYMIDSGSDRKNRYYYIITTIITLSISFAALSMSIGLFIFIPFVWGLLQMSNYIFNRVDTVNGIQVYTVFIPAITIYLSTYLYL